MCLRGLTNDAVKDHMNKLSRILERIKRHGNLLDDETVMLAESQRRALSPSRRLGGGLVRTRVRPRTTKAPPGGEAFEPECG